MSDANTPNTVGKGPELGTVEFLGKPLTVIISGDQCLVAMRPICEGIGLAWNAQFERIKRDEVLAEGVRVIRTPSRGGEQDTVCLPLNLLNGWLFGVDAKRCKPFIRQALVRYKFECYDALAAYWQGRKVEATPVAALPSPDQFERLAQAHRGFRIEFLRNASVLWVKASCVCRALGFESSDRITRGLPAERKLVQMRGLQRHVFIDPEAAMRASGYCRDVQRGRDWEAWLAQVLPVLLSGSGQPSMKPGGHGVRGKTGACLFAVQQAMKTVLEEHRQLWPVLQATGSRHLYGVEAALEVFQHADRYLNEQYGESLADAAEEAGLQRDAAPSVIGFKLADALGYRPLMPALAGEPQPALSGQLLEPEAPCTPAERTAFMDLQQVRLLSAYDERGQMKSKSIDPDAVICRPDQFPEFIKDSTAFPQDLLVPVLEAVSERLKRAA